MNDYIIRKINNNKKYSFYDLSNKQIKDSSLIEQLQKIYIPPAYSDVKIYLNKNVLATGVDNAGRKQYIYSEGMKKKREDKKYCKLVKMSLNIEKLKKHVKTDLEKSSFTKNKLIALIIKIMELCNFRCGNKKYEEKYGSHGMTTLHKKHLVIKKTSIDIDIIGKK